MTVMIIWHACVQRYTRHHLPPGWGYSRQMSFNRALRDNEEGEEEEEFITSCDWRGKHDSLSRGAGADPP